MVQDDISTSEPQPEQLPKESEDDFGIEDTTPQSVLDAENKFLNSGAVDDSEEEAAPVAEDGAEPKEPAAETKTPEAPVTEEVTPSEPAPTPVAEPAPTSPPPGYRSDADFAALQAAKDRENALLRKQVSDSDIETKVEAQRRILSDWYTQQNIDPSQVNQKVEAEVGQFRENLQSQSQLAEAQLGQAASDQQHLGIKMDEWALHLKREYSLSDADTQIVHAQSNVQFTDEASFRAIGANMGAMAARLGSVTKAEESAKKLAEVPAGSVQLENGGSNAPPADPQAALVRSAMSKLVWTDEEDEAMRRRAYG